MSATETIRFFLKYELMCKKKRRKKSWTRFSSMRRCRTRRHVKILTVAPPGSVFFVNVFLRFSKKREQLFLNRGCSFCNASEQK